MILVGVLEFSPVVKLSDNLTIIAGISAKQIPTIIQSLNHGCSTLLESLWQNKIQGKMEASQAFLAGSLNCP